MAHSLANDEIGVRRSEPASLYVNYFEVAHNAFEFLIELGQFRPSGKPGSGDLSIHTRLAISPPYAKMLAQLLSQAVVEHETEHGQIAAISGQNPAFDIVLRSLPEEFEARAQKLRAKADSAHDGNAEKPDQNASKPRGGASAPSNISRPNKSR